MTEAVTDIITDPTPADPAPAPAPAPAPDPTPDPVVNADPAPAPVDPAPADPALKKESPWPDNWRDLIADGAGKDSEDMKKLANKYGGPSGMAKALLAAQREISTRGLVKSKPEDATDEKAMAEWRKAVGIPPKAEEYKLPDDVLKELTDADKPVFENYTEFAHQNDMTPDVVAKNLRWYNEMQRSAAEMQAQADKDHAEKCTDVLYDEWGRAEFKGNRALAARFLDQTPLGQEGWGLMRKADGTMLANDADFMRWASDMGRNTFGDAVFANSDVAQKHDDRKKEIETVMSTDIRRYRAEKLDLEYAQILEKEDLRKK